MIDGDDVFWMPEVGSATIPLIGVVTDDDGPTSPPVLEWTVIDEPNSVDYPAIISPAIDDEVITVTATLTGTYELKLTAFDGLATGEETVTIAVYNDCGEAAEGEGVELLRSDVNKDCVTDLADLAILAAEWLESMELQVQAL